MSSSPLRLQSLASLAMMMAMLTPVRGAAADETTARLRLLPLGEMPPFRQEIRDGVRRELDPPEGSIPPRTVEAPAPEPQGAPVPFRLILGMASPPAVVRPAAGQVSLTLQGGAGSRWLEIACPPASRTLAVIWRPAKTWDKPQALLLPELAPDHDPRRFRFVNVAPQAVGIVFGEQRLQLLPGRSLEAELPAAAKSVPVTILFADPAGGFRPCYSGTAEAKPGQATQYFIFRADGESPRRPVHVTLLSGPPGN